ncbi:tRNA dihydrouridine synthase DusB [Lentilitoribacter sp. EG35]|uniref:tRNA dihydrouridine synthase DusB n=1 Tax=Lentilitoribacter sp. EG35 TaxID=3234192 RepID=UPI003460837D
MIDPTSSLKVGPLTTRNRVILAPMSGVSDLPFRQLAYEYGAGMVVTEMVASRELVGRSAESQVRLQGEGISPHVVQLAGRQASWMSEAAKISEASGADMIDINMGCPAKKVTGGYSGSALMRDLDLALELIEATIEAVNIPVSVKMRLGWDENSMNAAELARRAEQAGVQMVTVHGRTRSQFYDGHADWTAIANVRAAVTIPFIANGDVETVDDVDQILKLTGADAVMVGRQCQGRPWHCGFLAGDNNSPKTSTDIYRFVRRHYLMMIDHYGEKIGIRQSRKHLNWYLERYAQNLDPKLRTEILSSLDVNFVVNKLEKAIDNNDENKIGEVA